MNTDKLKRALIKDFNELYVKEFTMDWKVQRILRGLEIKVMGLPNTEKLISEDSTGGNNGK